MKSDQITEKRIEENSGFLEPNRHENLGIFRRVRKSGKITEVSRADRSDLMRPLGSRQVTFSTRKGSTDTFYTKHRKGLRLRTGQRITVWTLRLPASAHSYEFNVVRIDVDGHTVYRWSPKDVLWSFARC